jgi:uncharacterized repeat protein (TIGR03803 family)
VSKLNWYTRACALFVVLATMVVTLPAQTFKTLDSFDNTDGEYPWATLVQGRDGNFYGTTQNGGNTACSSGCGTLFKITPNGKLTTFSFDGANGSQPFAGLVQAANGDFYGVTLTGGTDNAGTVFKITLSGKLTTLFNFNGTDGNGPTGTLIQASDGNFYGTTQGGGPVNQGTVFKITPSGALTTLYTFTGGADGVAPVAGLIQATDGNLYGTTWGDAYQNLNVGTVFKITLGGKLTTVHSFQTTDGANPQGGLVQGTDGNLYGATEEGGTYNYGTVFKMTLGSTLTTLHSFSGGTDGDTPVCTLIQATDGNFYGTAAYDGLYPNFGTVFAITPSGTLTTLHNFDSTDGSYPYAGLVQSTSGGFYGATFAGGSSSACPFGCGTVFSLDMGLDPFVAFVHDSGKVGQTGGILGQGFTGTTGVSFNGTPAAFTVVSDTFIKATVPAGATTGYVTVTTPSGPLTSNVPFHVIR